MFPSTHTPMELLPNACRPMHMLLNFFFSLLLNIFKRLYSSHLKVGGFGHFSPLNIHSGIVCLKTRPFNLLLMKYTQSNKRSHKVLPSGFTHKIVALSRNYHSIISSLNWSHSRFSILVLCSAIPKQDSSPVHFHKKRGHRNTIIKPPNSTI